VLVHAMRMLGLGSTVLKGDRTANDGLGAQAGEYECQHRSDRAGYKTARDQTLLHEARSVAGEAE
jgi:hypothetical protein